MDAEATTHQWFDAVRSGNAKEFNNLTQKLLSQIPNSSELLHKTVGCEQNTIFHTATRHGHTNIVDAILKINSSSPLLNVKNSRGNTPMHVAAALGHAGVVRSLLKHGRKELVDQENGDDATALQEMLCAKNEDDNTPFHEAAKMGHKQVMEMLLKALDPTLSGRVLNEDNKVGETPLSLAVLATSSSTVEVMLNTELNYFKPRGPHNHTLLHLAVLKLDHATMKVILQKRPDLIKGRDIMGRTPMHYAAALGSYLLVQTLLKHDASMALLADDTQMLPIHLAAEYNDNIFVIQRFYRSNPSALEFTDIKRRNVLHVAAQNGNFRTVVYLMKLPEIQELINSADENENTPLHLSAKNRHSKIVDLLSRDSRVYVGAVNKDDHKAIDMINIVHDQKTPPSSKDEDQTNSSSNITSTLQAEEALRYGMMKQAETLDDVLKLRSYPRIKLGVDQKQKDIGMVVMMMATLVTTVTYAVVFQIPGGYITGDGSGSRSDVGMALLSKNKAFLTFISCDVAAMLVSMCATLLILWAFWRDDQAHFAVFIRLGLFLTMLAILHMALALAFGMFVVLKGDMQMAVVVFMWSVTFVFMLSIRWRAAYEALGCVWRDFTGNASELIRSFLMGHVLHAGERLI